MRDEMSHKLELGQCLLLLSFLRNEFLLACLLLLLHKLEQLHKLGSTQPHENTRVEQREEKPLEESHLFGVLRLLQLIDRLHPALQRRGIEPRGTRARVLGRNPRRLLHGILASAARRRWGLLMRRRRRRRGGGGGGETGEAERGAALRGVGLLGAERDGRPRGDGRDRGLRGCGGGCHGWAA